MFTPSRLVESGTFAKWCSHVLAAALAIHFLFGSALVINALKLEFFFYYPRVINIVLIDGRLDSIVWIFSVLAIAVLAVYLSPSSIGSRALHVAAALLIVATTAVLLTSTSAQLSNFATYTIFVLTTSVHSLAPLTLNFQLRGVTHRRVLIYLLAPLAVVETSSVVHYVVRSFDIATQVGAFDAQIELQYSYASYGLIPWLYVTFLFSWVGVPLVWLLFRGRLKPNASAPAGLRPSDPDSLWTFLRKRLAALSDPRLLLALVVVVFVGYYPYLHNPPWLVGTDAYWRYLDPLSRMSGQGGLLGFVQALEERHPLPLMLLYGLGLLFGITDFDVVRYTPLALIVAFSFFMWWFLGRKKSVGFGLLIMLLSAFSVSTTVGYYSSIIANWMVLVGWAAFLAYASYRIDEGLRFLDIVVLFAISTLMLLFHPWTWGILAVTIILAAILTLIHDGRRGVRTAGIFAAIVLLDLAFAYLSISYLAASQGWRVAESVEYYTYALQDPSKLQFFWAALTRLTQIWSPFFSPLSILLSILGTLALGSYTNSWRKCLVLAWLITSAFASVLVAPVGFDPARPTQTESQLWRVFFMTPFQLAMPFGVMWLIDRSKIKRLEHSEGAESGGGSGTNSWAWLVVLLVAGMTLAFAPTYTRPVILLILIPSVTAFFLLRNGRAEQDLLVYGLLAIILLVSLNSTVRGLSQLLLDPHNYR